MTLDPMTMPPVDRDVRGQFVVVSTDGWAADVIQWGTHSMWNHAAILTGGDGGWEIIEARPGKQGVRRGSLREYSRYEISDLPLNEVEKERAVAATEAQLGARYNWLDIAALAAYSRNLPLIPGVRARLESSKSRICSQVVAVSLTVAGYALIPEKSRWLVTPGDLGHVIEGSIVPERY